MLLTPPRPQTPITQSSAVANNTRHCPSGEVTTQVIESGFQGAIPPPSSSSSSAPFSRPPTPSNCLSTSSLPHSSPTCPCIGLDMPLVLTLVTPGIELVMTSSAPGVGSVSPPTLEYTWFDDYTWQVCVCLGCSSHVGWLYARFSFSHSPKKEQPSICPPPLSIRAHVVTQNPFALHKHGASQHTLPSPCSAAQPIDRTPPPRS